MDDATLGSYRSFKHPLFSVLLPFGFVGLLTAYLRAVVPVFTRVPGVFTLLLLIAVLSETAVGNYLVNKKNLALLPRMRELLVLLVFSLAFLKLVNGDLFRGDWGLGRVEILVPILLVALEWILSMVIHSALREREALLTLLKGKERGELKEAFRDLGTEAVNSLNGMTRVRTLIVVLQIIALLGLFILAIARPQALGAKVAALAILHFASGMVFFFTIGGYMEQQALMGDGFAMSPQISGRRATFATAVCAVASLALIPLIGRDAPLPSSYLEAFMDWLQRITTVPERQGSADLEDLQISQPDYQLEQQRQILDGMGQDKGNEALRKLLRTIILIIVAGGPAVAIIALLIAPLFRKREEKLHPLRSLQAWITKAMHGLAQGVRGFFASLKGRSRRRRTGRTIREMLFGRQRAAEGSAADARAGFFQRLALGREIKAFVKVIRWGEKRGVPFHRSLGPGEYAGTLGVTVPDVDAQLKTVADILEELLFSGREIAPERSSEYFEATKLVLRHR